MRDRSKIKAAGLSIGGFLLPGQGNSVQVRRENGVTVLLAIGNVPGS
ncbi:hypothetical protein [uncultured Fibrella sp.]